MLSTPRVWRVGGPLPQTPAEGAGVVGLTAADLDGHHLAVGFHEAMTGPARPAPDGVDVYVPEYRGKRLIPILAWLAATRLAGAGAPVAWHVDKRQGPDSVHRLLAGLDWRLDRTRTGSRVVLTGPAPAAAVLPDPAGFAADIGAVRMCFAADYGVFSPAGIDDGTALLLDVALRGPAVDAVADIGIGYGPLAIGLVRGGLARHAVGTDTDAVALWLALRNAERNEVPLTVACSPSPEAVGPTPLTVCNVPTHIDAAGTARLMGGLLDRARHGRVLAVVHASLENRYARYFTDAGHDPARHRGAAHVVFDTASRHLPG